MKGSIWNIYWKELKLEVNVAEIIENDRYYRLLKRLIKLPEKEGKLNILEVGCGSGIRTLALLRNFPNRFLSAVLVDLSSSALLVAKRNLKKMKIPHVNLIISDGLKLPFPNEAFDVVWNEGVNEHFNGRQRYEIFKEMSRVCKKSGQVTVIVPNALNLPYRIAKKILEIRSKWIYGLEKPYTIFELKDKMKNAGITPFTAGGAAVIGSIFTFLQLIPKRTEGKMSNRSKKSGKYQALKRVLGRLENICEISFGFLLAKDIGVGGQKK